MMPTLSHRKVVPPQVGVSSAEAAPDPLLKLRDRQATDRGCGGFSFIRGRLAVLRGLELV